MREKILTTAELIPRLERARRDKQRIVFTNGCFDLMHIGHTRYLEAAKALGDILVVGVNSDASVKSLKKAQDRPIVADAQRAEVLAALACVDYVVRFDEPHPDSLIRKIRPDVLVKGEDWAGKGVVGKEFVQSIGGKIILLPLVPGLSTTGTIAKIREAADKSITRQTERSPKEQTHDLARAQSSS